jgi:hypothetical protein
MWCLLQILFSLWEDSKIKALFRHHVSYVYSGIQDFYLSFLYFTLHCANNLVLHGGAHALGFKEFHFFYSTHLPFFLRTTGNNPQNHITLIDFVVASKDEFVFPEVGTKDKVKIQFDRLKNGILKFWTDHVKPLSDFIHNIPSDAHSAFFCPPLTTIALIQGCSSLPLTVESFGNFFNVGGRGEYFFYYIHYHHTPLTAGESRVLVPLQKHHNGTG